MDHKTLRESLKKFCADADARINAIARLEDLEKERPLLIGKNSMFYELAQNLKTLPPEEKREIGQFFNQEKSSIEDVFKKRREEAYCFRKRRTPSTPTHKFGSSLRNNPYRLRTPNHRNDRANHYYFSTHGALRSQRALK